jgi:hypothetical protein
MENKWLLTWLLAPIFSPAAMAVEAYSLSWYPLTPMRARAAGF